MKLTPKEELYVQGLVKGLSQREAYKEAYPKTRMKDSTIDVEASKLFKKPNISLRYEELVNEFKEKALYSREEAVNDLIWIKEKARDDISNPKIGLKQANGTVFLNSVKELCLLNDLYPNTKEKEDNTQEKDIAQVLKEALEDI